MSLAGSCLNAGQPMSKAIPHNTRTIVSSDIFQQIVEPVHSNFGRFHPRDVPYLCSERRPRTLWKVVGAVRYPYLRALVWVTHVKVLIDIAMGKRCGKILLRKQGL